jgi:hypothetical protein
MKEFQVELGEIKKTEDGYLVCGRCVGTEPIELGDFLNDLEVVKIEAYERELAECPPGLTARLTLSYKFREEYGERGDWLLLTLSEYKYDRSWKKKQP